MRFSSIFRPVLGLFFHLKIELSSRSRIVAQLLADDLGAFSIHSSRSTFRLSFLKQPTDGLVYTRLKLADFFIF